VVNATTNTTVFQTTFSEANADYFYPAVAVTRPATGHRHDITRTTGTRNGTLMVSRRRSSGDQQLHSWTFNSPTVLATGNGNYSGTRWGGLQRHHPRPSDPGIF